MASVDPATTVAALALERPKRTRLFEQLGLDYCCGGGTSLREACEARGLDLVTVVLLLERDAETRMTECLDWTTLSLPDLVDHIESSHHRYLRGELPRLAGLMAKVEEAHAAARQELHDLAASFEELRSELEAHLEREEQELFPAIRAAGDLPEELREQLAELVGEHEETGRLLREIRAFADDYRLDEAACMTHRALLDGLRELEVDIHQHVHEENHVLFPRLEGMSAGEVAGRRS